MPFLNANPILSRLIPISQAEIDAPTAAQLADYSAMYMLEEAPYTKYHSDGVSLVPFGATIYATSAEFSALVSASELVPGSIYNVDGVLRVALTSSTWVNVAMIVETYTAAQLVTKTGAGTLAPFTIYAASDTGELTWAPDDSTLVSLGTIPNFTAAQLAALAAAGGLTQWATYVASDTGIEYTAVTASALSPTHVVETTPYVNATASAGATVFTGACEYAGYYCSVAAGNITVYDNTSAAGTPIVPTTALATGPFPVFGAGTNGKMLFGTGCHVVLSGAATVRVLVQ
jgi:hypothetical protein